MFFVSMMVFTIMELPPGDYAERYAFKKYGTGGAIITESDMFNIRNKFGLDRPAYERYLSWVGKIVTKGDFGQSFAFETSVNNVIGQRLWLTLGLVFATLVLTYVISIGSHNSPTLVMASFTLCLLTPLVKRRLYLTASC